MRRSRIPTLLACLLFLVMAFTPTLFGDTNRASAWTDGNRDSTVYPNYGIVDMIVDRAFNEFNATSPEKAEFLYYWYLPEGADSEEDSYSETHNIPMEEDNLLAWTDDGQPDGDRGNYFINNRKGWEDIDAPTYVQTWANRTIENLTAWFMAGKPDPSSENQDMHRAAYCAGRMSRYVTKMSQYGHTDYSRLDQARGIPVYDPSEVSYQEYYEANLWDDQSLETLISDYMSREMALPEGIDANSIHVHTADLAKWVNGRNKPPVQMVDHNSETITVGANYKEMLFQFIHCWENDVDHLGVRGFNSTLWNLTLQNMIAATENLTAMYEALYDEAYERFLTIAPDLKITNISYMPNPVIAGDMVFVNATILNDGLSGTSGFMEIEMSTSGDYTTRRPLSLGPGEMKNVSFSPFTIGTDEQNIKLVADYDDRVAESNETNNNASFSIGPLPELHSSELSLMDPITDIRRDTIKEIEVVVRNTGNRYDSFVLSGSVGGSNMTLIAPDEPLGVPPYSVGSARFILITGAQVELGTLPLQFNAVGENSSAELEIDITVIERTSDPLPQISGPKWSRIGEDITLSARGSTDPDGDALYFKWIIPDNSNLTGPEITINFTEVDQFEIELEVFDGNTTVSMVWPFTVYPLPPDNLTAEVSGRGISGLTVSWKKWNAGGLISYWLEASALPGQGDLSGRGPFIARFGPGNNSGTVGKFFPQTEVEIRITVEAERYGNRTLDILTTTTKNTSGFSDALNMYIDNMFLYVQYKPWETQAGAREPNITIERWANGFMDLGSDPVGVFKTRTMDTIKYPLLSNNGRYRAYFTYFWANETISPFSISSEIDIDNPIPEVNLTGTDRRLELDINGTCKARFQLEVYDPIDTIYAHIEWGDGTSSDFEFFVGDEMLVEGVFHNYSEIGKYDLKLKVSDWAGKETWVNETIEVHEYSEKKAKKEEESSIVNIIVSIVLGLVLAAVIAVFGYMGYKFSKKDTEVDFDIKKMGSDISSSKVGTGTDFDKRQNFQIPQESIIGGDKKKVREDSEEDTTKGAERPILDGNITFDEE